MSTWNTRLKQAVDEAGMKPADLARAVKVSTASVSEWLSGKTKTLKAENAERICKALNINYRWLISGRGLMRNEGNDASDHNGISQHPGNYAPSMSPRLLDIIDQLDLEDLEKLEETAELYLLRKNTKK